jgi:hypothetical protein
VVSNNDDFIGDSTIDDADNVPQRSSDIFLFVVKVDYNIIRGGTDVVFNTLVLQAEILVPVLVKVGRFGTVTVESLEDRKGITV